MSAGKLVGVILIVLGALVLVYRGFTYTDKETVVDIGPIEATAETRERVNIPPWVGGVIIAGGVVLLLASPGKRRTM